MSKELKIISIGAVLCVLGGIAMDCGFKSTGATLISIGALAVLIGPIAVNFYEN